MHLDTRTMIFAFATGSLIMAIGLLIVNARSAHMRLMTLWVLANFALFGAWTNREVGFSIPGLAAVDAAFALFTIGYALEFGALRLFCGYRLSTVRVIGWIVISILAGTLIPIDVRPLIVGAWLLASAVTLVTRSPRPERTSRWLTGAFFAAVAIGDGLQVLDNEGAHAIYLAINYIGLFGTSLGFIMMTKERTDHELQRSASFDSLTALFNRRTFLESAHRELIRAERQHLQTSVLMLDLDHFKSVNDTYGHTVGDLVLQSFGAVLRASLRSFDVVGRYGGEEFCVLLPGTGINEATAIAERVRAISSQTPVVARGATISYTVSTGVVQASPGVALEELVDKADKALYRAKASGRNCVCAA